MLLQPVGVVLHFPLSGESEVKKAASVAFCLDGYSIIVKLICFARPRLSCNGITVVLKRLIWEGSRDTVVGSVTAKGLTCW